ncbi:MAG: hypothetical protein M3R01_03880 [Actinomycetota bacterium]|nr:hypothetical protein [Actinomycetota bacterium]
MPYATGRVYYDADSHVMETSDWLEQHAEPGIRERLRPLALGGVTVDDSNFAELFGMAA